MQDTPLADMNSDQFEDIIQEKGDKVSQRYAVASFGNLDDPKDTIGKLYNTLVQTAEEHLELLDFLIAELKTARGKQSSLLARGVAAVEHPESRQVFDVAPGDKSLRR